MSQVTREDQLKINEFSKLNSRALQHEQALDRLRQDKEYLDDVALELELVDDGDKFQYKIGDGFIELAASEVVERLEREQASLEERISERSSEADSAAERMAKLKAELYSKFGNAINLERE